MTQQIRYAFPGTAEIPLPGEPEKPSDSYMKSLTKREREILQHLSAGKSNKAIALTLCISHDTVKLHVRHILSKLGLTSRVEAAVFAVEHRVASHSVALQVAHAGPGGRAVGHPFNGNAPLSEALFINFNPEFAPPTIASAEEINYARELRRQLRTLYFERLSATESQWCVGAD